MAKQPPGHLAGKMKWLVARYPKPEGELIFLGSILTDPEEPESSLNRKTGAVEIPEKDKLDDSAAVQRQIHSEFSTDVSALLKAVPPLSPLFSAGARVEGSSSDEVQTTVKAMNIEANIFFPDKLYMDKVLAKPEITAYIKAGAWAKSLYMIVGVATAGSLTVTEEQSQEMKASVSAHASVTGAGIGIVSELSGGTKAKGGSTLKTEHRTAFAYRVREFEYCKFRLSSKLKDKGNRIEGAMFGMEGSRHNSVEEEYFLPIFECWAKEDIVSPDRFTLTTEAAMSL